MDRDPTPGIECPHMSREGGDERYRPRKPVRATY
jgi:hypothetical protein